MKNSICKNLLIITIITLLSACASSSNIIDNQAKDKKDNTKYTKEAARTINNIKDQKEAKVEKEKLICRTVKVVGSNIPKRICRTKQELEDAKKDKQDTLDSIIRSQDTFETPVPIG